TLVPTTYLVDTTLSNSSDSDQTVQAVRLRGACEAIRWWIKDGGRDCRIRSNNCYGQVSRRDQESALACWGIDR
ncbi:hypothetical protein ACU48J_004940, partial [Escherichia coli]